MLAPERWLLVADRGHAKHRARGPRGRFGFRTSRWVAAGTAVLVLGGWWTWDTIQGSASGRDSAELTRSEADPPAPVVREHHIRTTFLDDERARVTERLSFTRAPDPLVLSNPERTGSAAGMVPIIVDLWVHDGSGRRRVEELPPPGGSVSVTLPASPGVVRIGYLVRGIVVRSDPSPAGRALALATPLRVPATGGSRSVEVRGVEVENLGCLTASGRLIACGSRSGSGWSVTVESGGTDVLAQLTFPVG